MSDGRDAGMMDALEDLRNACAEAERIARQRERLRQLHEPPPEQIAGEEYVGMVKTVKRLAVEFDDIEKEGAFTKERAEKLRADVKEIGQAIYSLGGIQLMHLTLELYVTKQGGMHGCFDRHFDGIGGWAS